MKKMLRGFALALCLALLLTACAAPGARERENTDLSERRERREKQTQATAAPAATEEPAATAEPQATPAADAVSVRFERQDPQSDIECVRISGLDARGETVWQREVKTEYRTELTLIEEIGVWKDRYYFNNNGTVTCLRITDGALLWENADFGGASISSLIDAENGNVYLCGWYGPDFYDVDAEGNTVANYRSLDRGYFWPSDMRWHGPNELEIFFYGCLNGEEKKPYYIDLRDLSISCDFGYRNLSANAQYWANIFVSDFAEQGLTRFPTDGSEMELADFAHRFCKINRGESIGYEDGWETVSLETVNALCMRFFSRELQPEEGVLRTDGRGHEWKFENGKFYFPAADGEAYNRFAVVQDYLLLENGDMLLNFNIYELDLQEYWERGMDDALYRMNVAEADQAEAAGRLTFIATGTALVTYIEQNGHDGYLLHDYETDLG